jgi:hypothetical protein
METQMLYDRKTLTRLVLVFGISTMSYAIAGLAATQARDHLLARAQMLHDMHRHIDAGGEDVIQFIGADGEDALNFTATLPAAR